MLLDAGGVAHAVAVFGLNARLHPKSANALDSLAMGYETANDAPHAIASYAASLKLDLVNTHALGRLVALRGAAK